MCGHSEKQALKARLIPGHRTFRGSALAVLAIVLFILAQSARAQDSPYFTLSTDKTFAPSDKPKIHLYTRNVPELEFRVYRVQDEEKFLGNLAEMHSFGDQPKAASEDIDEKTWIERFHDWKDDLRVSVRRFFRAQLSQDTRDAIREKQSTLAQRSRIVDSAQFALVPLLNSKQLVARWKEQVPATFVTDNQVMPLDPLPGGMYLIEATDGHIKAYTLLLISQTAMITRSVPGQLLAFIVDRKTGEPVSGVEVTLAHGKQPPVRIKTGSDGVAAFDAPAKAIKAADDQNPSPTDESDSKQWVLARSHGDVALVAPWYSSYSQSSPTPITDYTYTDRPVYRPGHTVFFKSVLRAHQGNSLILPHVDQAHVTVTDTDSKTIYDKQLAVSSVGTISGSFDLPADAALGDDTITIEIPGQQVEGSQTFHVEDYRKPEYQVRVSTAKPRVLLGDSNTAIIDARYFFGEPVTGAKVKYRIYQSPHFWWGDPDDADDNAPGLSAGGSGDDADTPSDTADGSDPGDENSEQTGKLDRNGKLTVPIPTHFKEDDHNDQDMVVEAGVTDPAGREITGRYHFLATYGTFRIHVEPLSYVVTQGGNADFRITAVDYDNKPIQTPFHLHIYQHHWQSGGKEDVTVADANGTTDTTGAATITLPIKTSGALTIEVTANTPEHRKVQDDGWLWVNGSHAEVDESDTSRTATIIADKKSYVPGDTAHLTLVSQVPGFHALVMASGYTQEFRKVLSTTSETLTFDVPITRDSQPNVIVEAMYLKDGNVYHATKSLKVPPAQQQLQISVTPAQDTFQPGQAAIYNVDTRDWQGHPVSADLSFGVVDEAIYSLYPDTSGDIVRALYPKRSVDADLEDSLSYYFTGEAGNRSPMLAERHSRYRPSLAQVKPGNDVVQPRIRKAFPDTAFWQPDVHTDASGHARVTLNFPDSLTTWRATVRAITADSKAGSMLNRVIVRKNIIVRMGQPRFMRKGDVITVPVIVHNYLTDTKQVQVSLEATGVDIISGASQQVTIAPRGEVTVPYRLHAATIGTAKLTAKALSTQESDALEISLPIHPSGVSETLAASGVLANNGEATPPLNFPAGTDPAAHSLQIQVSPSIAGSLFSALDYLTGFPYGCTEQTMSSFLPDIIVTQAMQQLHIPSHTPQAKLNAEIEAGITRLTDYHHTDGGWGWWKEDTSQVFMTSYVVSGLAQAVKAGYPHAQPLIEGGTKFLRDQLAAHPRMKPELRAYVVYALAEAGSVGSNLKDQLDTLYSRRSDLSPQALAYTGLAMLDTKDSRSGDIARLLESKAKPEGDFASWQESRNELLDIDYDGSAETTAFVLKFLAHADPGSPLLAKSAAWLAANRTQGYWWSSTQQTAFVIYGLTDYLAVSHELNADIDTEVFVNGASVGKRHFSQADAISGAVLTLQLDATHLQPQSNSIRVVTHGNGHAYWSLQGGYYSTAKSSYQRGSMNLNVARDYFVLVPTQRGDHIVYTLQPLSGPAQVGDVLAVHVGITGSPQKYLMLEDPIPSGTEFVSQADTASYNIEKRPDTWDYWYTREEFHDDRAAIFSSSFDGRHDSFYLIKVTNPGSFAISPARVAPMYQPGVQATTDELHLDVKETPQ